MSENQLRLRTAQREDIEQMLDVIHQAFEARQPIYPPSDALSDTAETIAKSLDDGDGILAYDDDKLVGCILVSYHEHAIGLHRVSVIPSHRQKGIAQTMVRAAVQLGMESGKQRIFLAARKEFPTLIEWWEKYGFSIETKIKNGYVLSRSLPVQLCVPTAADMKKLGEKLAKILRGGDVVLLNGELGAGKTTITQGIGIGLGVSSPVISPTFVLSRIHLNDNGPDLIHVDAYRLQSAAELEDIDLENTLTSSVTIVEWGEGIAEWLSDERLVIDIERSLDPNDDTRQVYLTGFGPRWIGVLTNLREQ